MTRAVTATTAGGRRGFVARLIMRLARGRPMGIGLYMFVGHRLTAVALTVYLYVHLVTLGSVLQGPDDFDRVMALMDTPTIRVLELVLVWIVLFHMLNGLRLTLLAIAPTMNNRWLAYGIVGLSIAVVLLSVPLFLW